MAISQTFRVYEDNGITFRFSHIKFRNAVKKWQSENKESYGKKISLDRIFDEIGKKVGIGSEAVKQWYYGNNGPGNVDMIKDTAVFLGIELSNLIDTPDSVGESINKCFEPTGDNEKVLVRDLYRLFVDYIYLFAGTYYESNALMTLESEYEENDKYIQGLYKYLDSIALDIKPETFLNLRKTITELKFITEPHDFCWFPESWIKINPYLGSDDFQFLRNGTLHTNWSTYCSDDIDDPDKIIHLFLEDMPEIVELAKETIKQTSSEYRPNCIGMEINNNRMDLCYMIYELIIRETTMTLTQLMKKRFSDLF